jgi:3-methyladenine DNA glycosylase AlkD
MRHTPESVLEELKNLAEDDYKTFSQKIIPTRQSILGVRLPALRKIAGRIAKENDMAFVRSDKPDIHEMIMLEGMVLAGLDEPFKDLLPFTETFLKKTDNWAQIDSTVCRFTHMADEKEEVLEAVRRWLTSDMEFVVRAGLVILLTHYVREQNLGMIFDLSQSVSHSGYYARMANAWLISVCMARYPLETIIFFQDNALDDETHNKAIQKSRESRRVSKEHKALINGLKRPRERRVSRPD